MLIACRRLINSFPLSNSIQSAAGSGLVVIDELRDVVESGCPLRLRAAIRMTARQLSHRPPECSLALRLLERFIHVI